MRFKKVSLNHYTRVDSKPLGARRRPVFHPRWGRPRKWVFIAPWQLAAQMFVLGFLVTLLLSPLWEPKLIHAQTTAVTQEKDLGEQAGSGQVAAVVLPEKLTLRIEIRKYICEVFGKDCEKALSIAYCESRYNPEAVGVNKNGTVDRGVFQLNTVHHHITSSCAFDARCNIEAAYQLFKKQGWKPWVCSYKV